MTVEELTEMTYPAFARYVRENVGNDDPSVWDSLQDPSVAQATREVLTAIRLELDSQLSERRTALEEAQRGRIGRFQSIACGTSGCQARIPFDQADLVEGIRDLFRHWTKEHPEYASGEPLFLHKNLASTLTPEQRDFLAAEADYNDWKRRTKGYKNLVVMRIDQVKLAISNSRRPQPNATKTRHNVRTVFNLAYAVLRHREAALAAGAVPELYDLELWEKLDEECVFTTTAGAIPLTEWLDDIMSKPDWTPPEQR